MKRKLLSLLILMAMLVTTVSPALAQEASDPDAPTGARQLFLPLVTDDKSTEQVESPDDPPPAQPPPDDTSSLAKQPHRITPADRKAAAERAAALGFEPSTAAVGAAAMPGATPHYFSVPNYANSPLPTDTGTGISGGIRKFVDGLPGLGAGAANNLGQYIPVAVADTTTYPGADYYEIAVVQYEEQMHSDLAPTKLRGYVQLATTVVPGAGVLLTNPDGTPIRMPDGTQATGVDQPHYLGPLIAATKDKPVRILFRNLLPTGVKGDLFIPVDSTVMGAGMGPNMGGMDEPDPQNPMCGMYMPGMDMKSRDCFSENRATLHLHGGLTPWISDGTPHQWITPANEDTAYPQGVSVKNVPDMPDPGPGAQTFFYTNQQSARLMFYHDHAWGITRLNVYAGEAAGYLITDAAEQKLITDGTIPADQIPLVIQDKTFVPSMDQLVTQDPTWDMARWGDEGDLWVPHVYVPAQNPGDASGVNQFGRWAYGPWFWPPTTNIAHGPIANPYYDPNCNPDIQWCEPMEMPGVPYISMGMEAFNDTPMVNGAVYPTLTVDPKSYRLRVLNAANDRFFNLSLYKAVDANGAPCDATNLAPTPESTGVACTEVALNPAEVAAALDDQTIFPTPLPGTEGPDWIQIGTEGGFLPAPAVIPAQYTTWVNDPTVFNAGNVDLHSLLLGPAERADVVVDFSQFAGQTLILYNDAPAAFPARDPRYDYYTGNANLIDTGGAPSTLPGYGPNTRTVMQIKVADAPPAPVFDLAALQVAFAHKADGSGVFESSQHPIIVGQGAYNSAYGTSFFTNGPLAGLVQIFNTNFTFKTLAGINLSFPLQPKQIQDEMGEAFDPDYGRMSGFLGLEKPGANAGVQNMILYPYVNPTSEILDAIDLPPGATLQPITTNADGTQIWKITHNGVDTHPIHFHLTDVQLINRVGWDGIIRRPDPNELGWKDTVRISPLEDTIVAMRAILPKSPFGVPDSARPLNPMMPLGWTAGFNNTDANGNPIPAIVNEIVNFGWEYVWHCHILSHEEMDMMRPLVALANRALPAAPVLRGAGDVGIAVNLTWTDGTVVTQNPLSWGDPSAEIGYRIERSTENGPFQVIDTALANVTTYADTTTATGLNYQYRVVAFNAAGDSPSNVVGVGKGFTPPADPTNLQAALVYGPQINLTWTDNADNETSYVVERRANGGAFATLTTLPANSVSFTDNVQPSNTYAYRVYAQNHVGPSGNSNTVTVVVPPPPATPGDLFATLQAGPQVALTWQDSANNETSYVVERSDNGGAFAVVATLGANVVNYVDLVQADITYTYRVQARNVSPSGYSSPATVVVPPPAAAPTNLQATAAFGPKVDLTWTDNANNETGYLVERSDNGGAFASVTTLGANTAAYTDATVAPGNAYDYRVVALSAVGPSAPSNVASVTVAATPGAPTNLQAALQFGPQISLTWTDNATDETGFVVERRVGGGGFALLATLGANSTAYVDNVNAGSSYAYRVYAVNIAASGFSNVASLAVPAAISAPSSLRLTVLAWFPPSPGIHVRFFDNATTETGFVIERSDNGAPYATLAALGPNPGRTTVLHTDRTVLAGQTYTYRVYAINGVGPSAYSGTATAVVPSAPSAPANFNGVTLATSATAARISLTWVDTSNNESRFVIQRATDAAFTSNLLEFTRNANTSSYVQTGLPRGATYYYRIMAYNRYGQSTWVNLNQFPITTP